jgi:hypothetical protein
VSALARRPKVECHRCDRAASQEARSCSGAFIGSWQPICARCLRSMQADCDEVAEHEISRFGGGAYGVPRIERRALQGDVIDAEIVKPAALPTPPLALPSGDAS